MAYTRCVSHRSLYQRTRRTPNRRTKKRRQLKHKHLRERYFQKTDSIIEEISSIKPSKQVKTWPTASFLTLVVATWQKVVLSFSFGISQNKQNTALTQHLVLFLTPILVIYLIGLLIPGYTAYGHDKRVTGVIHSCLNAAIQRPSVRSCLRSKPRVHL